LAARFHDLGKRRGVWQRSIGNDNYPDKQYAKSGRLPDGGELRPREITDFRHEFGSLVDVLDEKQPYLGELQKLAVEVQDVVLHLIAVHHGYGRPHFPIDNVLDPEPKGQNLTQIAAKVQHRFAKLQREYGRWGLAYLESLLRAADWAASANPSPMEEACNE
jgi:CRISPR-associated endonuclease/helicase Cas3